MVVLLKESLPSDWSQGKTVLWHPEDKNHNHPPRDWIELIWRYVREHFPTREKLHRLQNFSLIPVSMKQSTVTLKPLTQPSTVVIKSLGGDIIDDALIHVLTKMGGVVLTDCPDFILDHPSVLDTFVHRPNVQGIFKTIVKLASTFTTKKLSEVVRGLSHGEKRSLRSFLANVKPVQLGKKESNLICSLPIFETFSKRFVSKNEGLSAALIESLPIQPRRELIDISEEESKSLAVLLKVRILKPTEVLCEIVFPDIQSGKYDGGQIDKLMPYVLTHFAHVIRSDAHFKWNVQALPFLPKANQSKRVKGSDIFDPRNKYLRKLFANENVFPVGPLYNGSIVLNVLEEVGMKSESDVTAKDLLRSAKNVSGLSDPSKAREKSQAILQHLERHPQKLKSTIHGQELRSLLMKIQWVPNLRQKTSNFPPSLPWFKTGEEGGTHFFKPSELKSQQVINLIGSVKPVIAFEPSSEIAGHFGWLKKPEVVDIANHLQNVVRCYTSDEKAYYMVLVNDIYAFLSCANYAEVTEVLSNSNFGWVWNGDGFSSPNNVLSSKPAIDLTPFIRVLPSEMIKHSQLFTLFGMRTNSDPSLLLQVLGLIKEKYDGKNSPVINATEVRHDLQLSVDILNELASGDFPLELQREILLPVRVDGNLYVQLEPVECCMYTEQKEWTQSETKDGEQKYYYVHHNVPNNTAVRLGVPSLTHRMLDPDELSIGEEFGQEEKLTTRLNRLLEDYKDGLAVLKELVQNADDAGATEVKFLYDERTNEDAMTCLIDDGMKKCQGAALWVYNDATFKSEDFVNITKLNEATKVHDTAKIGRFGLGFNAVYNLTDVPMFVSKNYFVILDPNTSHLGTAINNKRKPGIKIDLNKDVINLKTFRNQFKPFNGVFGCDLSLDREDNSYNGTLFRFPLRTREQAAVSEIRDKCYDDQEMRKLLKMFLEKANSLLLFTQNVFRVGMYFLPKSSGHNLQPLLMFQVNKSLAQGGTLRALSFAISLPDTAKKLSAEQKKLLMQSNFLQASSQVKRNSRGRRVRPSEFPESSIVVDVECVLTQFGASFFEVAKPPGRERENWLIVSSMGSGESMEFAESDSSLVPSGGVAAQLLSMNCNTFLPIPAKNGTVFCYLPLPIHSGLPVCINGAFAVDSNRRRLQGKLEDDKTCYGEEWNNVLMADSVSTAYLSLLEDLKKIVPQDGSYVFHSLWPRVFDVTEQCRSIAKSFYKQIVNGTHALFSNGIKWVDIADVVFLHPDLRVDPEIGDISFDVFRNVPKNNEVVIDLPPDVFHSFDRCGLLNAIKGKTYDKLRFFRDVFFPNISRIACDLRDVLVLHALNQNSKELEDLIMKNPCIPASPDGKILKRPSHLVSPNKEASFLFFPDDGRFPSGDESTFCHPEVLAKLEGLGMKGNDLPWGDVAERAESVQQVNSVDSKAAVKRAKVLLKFVQKKLKMKGKLPSDDVVSRILGAEFLPVLEKPTSFPLRWKSEEYGRSRRLLAAPKDVFLQGKRYLVCCTELLVDLDVPSKVSELLKLHERNVTAQHVIKQLEEAISTDLNALDPRSYEEVSRVCTEAYSFLQENTASYTSSVKDFLSTKRFILVGRRFLSADLVAFEVKADCSPYLYQLTDFLSDSFAKFLKFCGVRKQFEAKDYISGLQKIKGQFGQTKLDERILHVAVNMAIQLGETLKEYDKEPHSKEESSTMIYLPDSNGKMCTVADLCYKDCPWMPDDPEEQFIHEQIPWSTCKLLGVKTRREGALQQHDIGFPFGQKEELTNRLKRILTGYPGEKEILKELLQNADDAQATEIFFIKDPRHHPDKRVFQDSWKPLQGPALCVYNNRPFTNADIEGICNLGKGSKGEDPNKTGQYGVGFNAVYHLTDVPSFRSKGEEIGDVFCVFDPHCKYVPCASDAKPGRMYKDIDKLKKKFPDVFPCYLEELFPIKNATMFRFPLKSQEMAEESKISKKPVSVRQLDGMMRDLKMELFEVLLFVNNVRKISIAEIDRNEKLADIYSVEVVMTQEEERIRQRFADYMKQVGKQAKHEDFLPTSIQPKKCIYTMTLRDSVGEEETWLIVQQVGFDSPVKKSIVDAFRDENLGMLPRGGVACLLSSSRSSGQRKGKEGKAYCFLPLPFRTNLPVYINGHFALDHEARRNLWRDEDGGYRSDWNKALLRDVITSCYLTLLDKVRGYIQLPVGQDAAVQYSTFSKSEITKRLVSYEGLFPRYPLEDSHWRMLADSVYQEMSKKEMRLIPVVRSLKQTSDARAKNLKSVVTWFPPQGAGKNQVFFNNLEIEGCFSALSLRPDIEEEERRKKDEARTRRKQQFEETMLRTGFNLVTLSFTVYRSFKEAGVEVCCLCPVVIMDFFKSFSDVNPLCSIGEIPFPIDKTPFKDQEAVIGILKYCRANECFLDNLAGLPLLLTQDNYLRVFSEKEPRCLSHYYDILPRSPSLFVHNRVHCEVFNSVDLKKTAVFRPLDVQILSSNLHLTLPECFRSKDHHVRWSPEDPKSPLPNRRWIYRVWDFLERFASKTLEESDVADENKTSFIRDLLKPLSKWNILPATETSQFVDHYLVPLKMAETVLDFGNCGQSSKKLVEVLRLLTLPELNSSVMASSSVDALSYTKADSYKFACNLVATLNTPHSLLIALNQKLKTNPDSLSGRLKSTEAESILDYFSRSVKDLREDDKETLRRLPFFPVAGGRLGVIQDSDVFVLPSEIPKDEMEAVESRFGCLFLEPRQSLSDLYKFLGFHQLSPANAYLKFILKCFQHLSLKGKLVHLRYLRSLIFSESAPGKENEEMEKEQLLDYLKVVPFIPAGDGSSKTASSFYDPRNEVFRTMLSADSFPPKIFNTNEWLDFLGKIGLIKDVSQEDFVKFAFQVANEAESARTEEIYKKSEVLVHALISWPNVVEKGLLTRVRSIPFVASEPVKQSLEALCPPFGDMKNGKIPFIPFSGAVPIDYEEIVWTKAYLLPTWADPRFNYRAIVSGCPHGKTDKYIKTFLAQLNVIKEPTIRLVISHCQAVCGIRDLREKNPSTVIRVMERIYTFLQQKAASEPDLNILLQSTRCILVERGKRFILPKQAVLELYEHLEIEPFLYRVPPEFGKFQSLFKLLGCSKTVTSAHYAMVLELLQKKCQEAKLHPNEVRMSSKAVRGLFNSVQDDDESVKTLPKLYLPAVSPESGSPNKPLEANPVTLRPSEELIFDDAPTYGSRIHGIDQLFVPDLSLMEVTLKSAMTSFKDLMMKLPASVQPRMLSSVVKEKLSSPDSLEVVSIEAVNALKRQLTSVQFGHGFARIIRHVNYQKKGFDEGVIAGVERGLRSIELLSVKGLKTSLYHNNILIPESEQSVVYFKERLELPGKETWRVYISALTGIDETIWAVVTNIIVEMYGEFLGTNSYVITSMLRCPPTSIWSLLDKMGIRKDDSYGAAQMKIYPEPGTYIPVEDQHLLNDAFEEFEPGEYVGYQLHDPSLQQEEGTAIYIYAIVIEEVSNTDAGMLLKSYKIDIGHDKEPVVVSAARLHKFHRLEEIFDEQEGLHEDIEEVCKEISATLELAWELPEEERDQIVKRLFLRWFPKENVRNLELFTAAFQHLKSEISRLGGFNLALFASWEALVRERDNQRETYRENYRKKYGSWKSSSGHRSGSSFPPSFCHQNSQPGEAKRWFRQAEADLEAGTVELSFGRDSYEWICFKCHQVNLRFVLIHLK